MKLRKGSKLWAIGGRGWIEFRVARVAPKPHTTTVTKVVPFSALVRVRSADDWGGFRYVQQTKEKKHVLKTTTWSGGRVLGSLPAGHGVVRVPDGQLFEVADPGVRDLMLAKLEEKNAA